MERRSFIRKASLGLAAGALAAGCKPQAADANADAGNASPVVQTKKHTWRMVTTWPKNFPGLGVGAQRLADRITAASNGELTIQVFSAGEMVPALQSIDAVIDGSAEMMHGAAYYWQNKSQGLPFFTGVPFGMTNGELSSWVRYLGGQAVWDRIYDQFGLQAFLSGNTCAQAGGWFKKELKNIESVQGLRFRTPGLGGKVWQAIGASVTNLPAGEIFQALQSGMLDATEFVGPYNDLALGFHQVCKHYYTSSFIESGNATELVVNKSKFQALPKHLQNLIADVCQAEYDQVACDFYANDPRALQTLVREHGVQTHTSFPNDILQAGATAAKDLLTEFRQTGDVLTKETVESYISALNLLRTRTERTDEAFLQARRKYFSI